MKRTCPKCTHANDWICRYCLGCIDCCSCKDFTTENYQHYLSTEGQVLGRKLKRQADDPRQLPLV